MSADVLSCPLTKPCLEDVSGGYFADMSPHVCNVLSCPLTKPCPDAGHFQLRFMRSSYNVPESCTIKRASQGHDKGVGLW